MTVAHGEKFSDRQNICQKIHIYLWKKPLQNFWKYFFRAEKPLFIAEQKSRHLWHILCVPNYRPMRS